MQECNGCKQWFSSKHFRQQCTLCKSCQPVTCAYCGPLHNSQFKSNQIGHSFSHHRNVVCNECSNQERIPSKGTYASAPQTKQCKACNNMCALIKYRKRNGVEKDTCKDCELIPCAGCAKEQPNDSYDQCSQENYWKLSRKVVCKDCQARGCTNSDPQLYQCAGPCKLARGTRFFCKADLRATKRNKHKLLLCSDCKRKEAAMTRALENRGFDLL